MGILNLAKPEYILRPTQLVRRVQRHFSPAAGLVLAELPWGWPLQVHADEVIGRCIVNIGIYDLVVSELLWRLTDPGETVVDAGANIGYMTSILSKRVGPSGRVFSFEAHPEIIKELQANVARWADLPGGRSIQIMPMALSDREGTVEFEVPHDFANNRGTSRVAHSGSSGSSRILSVPCTSLDLALRDVKNIGIVKMDVEGHEEAVLRGALGLMRERRVREWILEHHEEYPSPVSKILEENGYSLLQVRKLFRRPDLISVTEKIHRSPWEPQSFLATLDPQRAIERASRSGWWALG